MLTSRVGAEFLVARQAAGLSQRQLGRTLGVSHSMIGRIERGAARSVSIELVATIAAVLGLEMSVGLHPAGPPVRDRAHLALIERLRVRVSRGLRWRTEVPVPVAGDLRSADLVIDGASFGILVEAETRLVDVQAFERRVGAKQRDLGLGSSDPLVGRYGNQPSDSRPGPGARKTLPDLGAGMPASIGGGP
jgi:transcriptional regulator with XRE-family HTH domain